LLTTIVADRLIDEMGIMLLKSWHLLEYDAISLVALVVGLGAVALVAFSI
jgi:hypothetical protein